MLSGSSDNIAYSVKHNFQKPFLLQDFSILIVSLLKMQNLRRVGLDGVENIDEDEKYCDKKSHPARDHLGRIRIKLFMFIKNPLKITSGFTRNEIQLTTTKSPLGR